MKTNLDLKELARLLRLLEKRNISEFEHEDGTVRVRVVRGGPGSRPGPGGRGRPAPP